MNKVKRESVELVNISHDHKPSGESKIRQKREKQKNKNKNKINVESQRKIKIVDGEKQRSD